MSGRGRNDADQSKPTDKILAEEYRAVERLMSERQHGRSGVVSCDLLDHDLTRWSIGVQFREGSKLQQGLQDYGEFVGDREHRNKISLRIYFPLDYPKTAPEVMVHEPRLSRGTSIVTFNGKVCTPLLGDEWNENAKAVDIVKDTILRLEVCGAEVAPQAQLVRPYAGKVEHGSNVSLRTADFPTVNNFCEQVYVLSVSQARQEYGSYVVDNITQSDRVTLPQRYMEKLYSGEGSHMPIMFELRTYEGRVRHMSISDTMPFLEYLPQDKVIVPDWVAADLNISPTFNVILRCVELPTIQNVVLQPHNKDFYDDIAKTLHGNSQQAALNHSVKHSRLSAVTVNSGIQLVIPTVREGDKVHMLEVIDVMPGGAVSLIGSQREWDIDFKVDFVPAPDFEDDEDRSQRLAEKNARLEEKVRAEQAKQSAKQQQLQEAKVMQALTERLQIGDETPNVGKVGDIEIRLTCPGGENLDGKFKEGTKVRTIVSFLMINSKWTEDNAVLSTEIRLSTAFPKATWSNNDEITKRNHHRQRVLVTRDEQEPEEEDMHVEGDHYDDTEAGGLFPRTSTSALETAWEKTQAAVAEREQKRQEVATETSRIVENAVKRPRPDEDPMGIQPSHHGEMELTDEQANMIEQMMMMHPEADPVSLREMLEATGWNPDMLLM